MLVNPNNAVMSYCILKSVYFPITGKVNTFFELICSLYSSIIILIKFLVIYILCLELPFCARKRSKAFWWHFICWLKTSRTRFCLAKLVLTILILVIHHAWPLLLCSLRHQSSFQWLLLLLTLWNIAVSSGAAHAFIHTSCCVLADLIISLSL